MIRMGRRNMIYIVLNFIEISDIVISTNDPDLIYVIKEIYPYCSFYTNIEKICNDIIVVFKYDELYRAEFKQFTYEELTKNNLYYFLYEVVQVIIEETMLLNAINVLHGACVEKDGNALVFSAKTNTGKSTLVFDLTSYGYNYISDDYAILSGDELKIVPLHLPIKLRTLSPVSENIKDNVIVRDYNPVRSENYYLVKPFSYCKNKQYKLNAFFLINRNDQVNNITKLNYKDSYKNLILNSKIPNLEAIKRINTISLSLAKYIDVYEINYTDTIHCRRMIESVIATSL